MILEQLCLLIATLLLAGKDADSYRLKDKNAPLDNLENQRIKRWHLDGVLLNATIVSSLILKDPINWWKYLTFGLLIRLSVFDIMFNKWSGLPYKFLGSTAIADKLFTRIFGKNGAIKKSIAFFSILIIINILMKKFGI